MIDSRLLILVFVAQVLCMAVDEFYFHHQRRLPRWERLGHPLDTLSVLLCWGVILFFAPTPGAITLYVCLSIFSSLFVTKDEWVHTKCCRSGEHWLHALLFIMHPLTLLSAALLWAAVHGGEASASSLVRYHGFERTFFLGNVALTLLFGLYQLIYWNLLWKNDAKAQSITTTTTT